MAEVLPQGWSLGLRRERERRGWSRKQLADHIKGSADTIYRWEEKGDKPRAEMLQALKALFGKPVEAWGKRIWHVPYVKNLYFTGRESILERLHAFLGGRFLSPPERLPVALSQMRAISGLGGIGKTQTAVEYALRYREEYDLVLWVRADSREALVSQFAGLASVLGLPSHANADQNRLAKAVKHWLETQQEQVWLLIFDNVDNLPLVKEFVPTKGTGAVLLTTRLQALGTHIRKIALDTLTLEEGVQFFQKRLSSGKEAEQTLLSASERQAAEALCRMLGGLPLALEQAAAYIEECGCSLAEYVARYQQQRAVLLRKQSQVDQEDYPHSVATTWVLSFQRVEAEHPAAAELLRLCAFLAPDAIPEEMLTQGAAALGPVLARVATNVSELNRSLEALHAYSLVKRHAGEHTLSIHRLVQAVLQDGQEEAEQHLWAKRALALVSAAFPRVAPETWPQCERLLGQALQVTQWIEQQQMSSEEASRLLFETAQYLRYRGRYAEAEPLYQRSLNLREHLWGPGHPQVATTRGHLGSLYREQGKFAEAELHCKQALDIWGQREEPEYAQVVEALNNLAIICTSRGQYAEAEPIYLRELAICEQRLGPRHDDTARTLNNLGNLYSFQGRYAEAEPLYLRALSIREEQLGPENSQLAYPLHGLGALYHYQDKYTQAEPLYRRALSIREQQLGPEHPQVAYLLAGLANLYLEQGQQREAEPLYQRALHIWDGQMGPGHPESAYPMMGLATLYYQQGKYAEAESLYRRSLRIWKEQMGETHLQTAETLRALAQLQEARGNHEAARREYERALALRKQALGASSLQPTEARQHLIALLRAMGQHEEAARLQGMPSEEGSKKADPSNRDSWR